MQVELLLGLVGFLLPFSSLLLPFWKGMYNFAQLIFWNSAVDGELTDQEQKRPR